MTITELEALLAVRTGAEETEGLVADIAVIGAGYVGVPLAQAFVNAGSTVVLVDVQQSRVDRLLAGDSYIEDVSSADLQTLLDTGLSATTDYGILGRVDAILIALPTPLSKQ